MALPTSNDYQSVMQHPDKYFADPVLKRCSCETDPMGLPRVRSGGFALTYRLIENHSRSWAVRCFKSHLADRQSRYRAISDFIAQSGSARFVKTDYLADELLVRGSRYPVTRMPWVDGETLSTYLERNHKQSQKVAAVLADFVDLVDTLEQLGVAHGDLTHMNMIVDAGRLVLIDYDGMYVPALKGHRSNELGNPGFQHPARTASDFDASLDRFSAIVLSLALAALMHEPSLLSRYATGDSLLFVRGDFVDPDRSALLHELDGISGLGDLVERFREVCRTDLANIPPLDDFIATGEWSSLPVVETRFEALANQLPTLTVDSRETLLKYIGDRVSVIGQVTDFHEATTRYGDPYLFLNFGKFPNQVFTVVFWSEALTFFKQLGVSPYSYIGRHVRVTGIMNAYGSKPQIIIESPADIQILQDLSERKDAPQAKETSADKGRPPKKLSTSPSRTQGKATSHKVVSQSGASSSTNDAKLTQLYGQRSASRTQPTRTSPQQARTKTPAFDASTGSLDISSKVNALYGSTLSGKTTARGSLSAANSVKQTDQPWTRLLAALNDDPVLYFPIGMFVLILGTAIAVLILSFVPRDVTQSPVEAPAPSATTTPAPPTLTRTPTRTSTIPPTLTRTPRPTFTPLPVVYSLISGGSVRRCPSLECQVVRTLVRGDEVQIVRTVADAPDWYEVRSVDWTGSLYVHSSILSPDKPEP